MKTLCSNLLRSEHKREEKHLSHCRAQAKGVFTTLHSRGWTAFEPLGKSKALQRVLKTPDWLGTRVFKTQTLRFENMCSETRVFDFENARFRRSKGMLLDFPSETATAFLSFSEIDFLLPFLASQESWVHANGGITNGGVACVGARWRVFAYFCEFLRFFVRFCAFFPAKKKWPAKKRKCAQNPAKVCQKRFYAMPPLFVPPPCPSFPW